MVHYSLAGAALAETRCPLLACMTFAEENAADFCLRHEVFAQLWTVSAGFNR